jgi:hypothetical protein
VDVVLNKKQVDYLIQKCGEKSAKKAFRMFLSAMTKEKISPTKMPLLINKMMAQDKEGKKE